MFFFNDECDFTDDDQYDLFTLESEVERRWRRSHRQAAGDVKRGCCNTGIDPSAKLSAREAPAEIHRVRQHKF
ncbi:MAG: hypothetical protein ACLPPV_04320 [Candidatus Korobacteraceae bacterium]|jgi:hypothetical protein